MKKFVTLMVLLSFAFGAHFIAQQQTQTDMPTYTPEQRWARAASQITVSMVAAISYAKSMGQTAEQFGEYCVKLFAPGWGAPDSGTLNIIRGVRRNFLMWTDSEFEITESSDKSVTARSNRPWSRYFGDNETWYGVTLGEFESCLHVFNVRLAEHLGLGYKDEIKNGWLYMTFSIEK